jgi:hypothetical protein
MHVAGSKRREALFKGSLWRTVTWGTQWGQLDGTQGTCCSNAPVLLLGVEVMGFLALASFRLTTLASFIRDEVLRRPPPPSPGCVRGLWFKDSYLVDSASSHMLVSKIKPCMSKYKQSIR